MTAKLWVKYKKNNSTQVSTKDCENVDDFLKSCKKELQISNPSQEISLSLTDDGPSLRPDLLLTALSSQPGYIDNNDENPLFISVIDELADSQGSRTSSESNLKTPHPKRKERWEKLNVILEQNKRKRTETDSTAYSQVRWSQVKNILKISSYIQSSKSIPDAQFNLLSQYLSMSTKCFGSDTLGNESQRLHLIAPIIICVCFLFNGDVQIEVEEDLNGDFLKAHGHFEFVLRRGDKRVCIVEAKKGDMHQGMAQDLLGCEVAAEIDHLDLVYGIVTNYVQWNFLRSLDEKIELEVCSMDVDINGPSRASLLKITGKIYAMLSDE